MQVGGGGEGAAADLRGRHRIQAELKKLEQEARFLEVCAPASTPLLRKLTSCLVKSIACVLCWVLALLCSKQKVL